MICKKCGKHDRIVKYNDFGDTEEKYECLRCGIDIIEETCGQKKKKQTKNIKFEFDYPPSVNHLYIHGSPKKIKTDEALAWEEKALWKIKIWKKSHEVPEGLNGLAVTLFRKDKRRIDIDNPLKEILDLMTKSELINDDSEIEELHVFKEKTKLKENYIELELFK